MIRLRGWPSHSMCSRPHFTRYLFTGKPDWPRADFAENCLLRAGSKASAVSRFREKLSPANGVQGITAISRKITLLGVMSAKLAKWVAKKWGPTCDRDISDSAIYTTAIYRAYAVIPKIMLINCQLALKNKNFCKAKNTTFFKENLFTISVKY